MQTGVDPRQAEACFVEASACASASLRLPCAPARVFDCLRNLKCLVHWWPGAEDILAVPPGVYGPGDVAVLKLRRESVGVLVIAYKPGRRIVLSLQKERSRLLVDLRVRASGSDALLELAIEAPNAPTRLAQAVQRMRLRGLCREAATGLERHLRASPLTGMARIPNREVTRCTSR